MGTWEGSRWEGRRCLVIGMFRKGTGGNMGRLKWRPGGGGGVGVIWDGKGGEGRD